MKHIKLFENFKSMYHMPKDLYEGAPVLVGYYGEGGHGSHPAVVIPEVAKAIEALGDHRIFITTSKEQEVPEALICIFHNDNWTIKGIPGSLAQSIVSKIGGEHLDGYNKRLDDLVEEVANMVGYNTGGDNSANISIIMEPKLNTIYWSDAPEQTHSYWEPPYNPISVYDQIEELKFGFNMPFGKME